MIGEVIAIGDEITTGQRLDTNTKWLSEQLTAMGVQVLYHTTVADDLDANVQVFRSAMERADVIVATGGLGPTADDLTRDALAASLGVELEQNDEALAHIQKLFEIRGRKMADSNKLQALFPIGSQQIFNPNGTAPGIDVKLEREGRVPCRLFALPGVPAEMKPMWNESAGPAIAASMPEQRVIRHRRIKCFGAGESKVEEMLGEMISRGREPLVGITASSATITLRITASGKDEVECFAAMEPIVEEIREKLGALVFGEDEELEDAVVRMLREREETLATSESDTEGRLAQMLSSADRSNHCFLSGEVSASGMLQQAEQTAQELRTRYNAHCALVISPFETAGDNNSNVTIALATEDGVCSKEFPVFGTSDFARLRTAKVALNYLRLQFLRNA